MPQSSIWGVLAFVIRSVKCNAQIIPVISLGVLSRMTLEGFSHVVESVESEGPESLPDGWLIEKRSDGMFGEPLKLRCRLWNPASASRWQWRNFPSSWGTFFSFQAPRGPGKKTLLSSSYTPKCFSGGKVTVCVYIYICMWGGGWRGVYTGCSGRCLVMSQLIRFSLSMLQLS